MAAEVVLPRQGWTMEVGSIVEWRKRDGDAVHAGEVLFTLQSDKSINEIEALDTGTLRIPPDSPAPGVEVPIGTLLAYIVAPGERAPFEVQASAGGASSSAAAVATGQPPGASTGSTAARRPDAAPAEMERPEFAAPTVDGASDPGEGERRAGGASEQSENSRRAGRADAPPISPRARRVAAELGVAWHELRGSGRTGRIVERDVRAAATAAPPRVSPLARRRAAELGVDLVALAAARPGRRLELADVEAAPAARLMSPHDPQPERLPEGEAGRAPPGGGPDTAQPHPGGEIAPVTGLRRIVAERMAASAATVAAVTLTTEADATELVALRERVRADTAGTDARLPSYNDLLVRIVALALADHPELNASWTADGIVRHGAVHVGVAVETERGLVVPVVRDVGQKSVGTIAAELARLIELARAGRATPDELTGGTFTITNLGQYEIDAFTPIVNLPECAILGVGRIHARPVVVDDASERVAVRRIVALSLTFDHRIVDGAPAARCLRRIKHLIERPHRWVLA